MLGDNVFDSSLGEFELDLWRFRLPPSTLPELATADFADGELVVTVPKEEDDDGDAILVRLDALFLYNKLNHPSLPPQKP
ncbi:hypothetical protein T459_18881 [Capsicum annuum]|uniref:SHSP domain-containing protein n=1 Tax=Capsicum annuum TaxID=4072 RepID=A0A2G2Z051_CAPAN|nr:hypothetical protein T459_18881 [Capsicum annuum]